METENASEININGRNKCGNETEEFKRFVIIVQAIVKIITFCLILFWLKEFAGPVLAANGLNLHDILKFRGKSP